VIRQRSVSAKIAAAISNIIHGAAAMNAKATAPRCSSLIIRPLPALTTPGGAEIGCPHARARIERAEDGACSRQLSIHPIEIRATRVCGCKNADKALFGRKAPRTDSAVNFIFDMEREGVITLIKREPCWRPQLNRRWQTPHSGGYRPCPAPKSNRAGLQNRNSRNSRVCKKNQANAQQVDVH
jgi:hypothetical protein